MHVFIDTNILLNFFQFSKDDLDALNDVFASHEHGAATVYLTEQVRDEFRRNRETTIKVALKRFKSTQFAVQLPSFMKDYEEFLEIKKMAGALQKKASDILERANADIANQRLFADGLINEIFNKSTIIKTTDEVYQSACQRMGIGNPPGKNRSIGDAINWIILLDSVPDGEDLHIISEDGDFFSNLDDQRVHPFLEQEWREKKESDLRIYRTLSGFLDEHFDGVAFSFDKDKDALVDDLAHAGSFAASHNLIAKLEDYGYFSLNEVKRILRAAHENGQFGSIIGDDDVLDFLTRVAIPRRHEIDQVDFIEILDGVAKKQAKRQAD